MANKTDRSLKIGHWNANGLIEKWTELKFFINKHDFDVMLINETKLTTKKLSNIPGYVIIRQDRPGNTAGGGLLAVVKNTLNYQETNNNKFTTIESLGIRVNNINIYTIYATPSNNNKIDKLELAELFNSSQSVILIGDFNAKHTLWNCKTSNYNGKTIYDYITINNLSIVAPDTYTLTHIV